MPPLFVMAQAALVIISTASTGRGAGSACHIALPYCDTLVLWRCHQCWKWRWQRLLLLHPTDIRLFCRGAASAGSGAGSAWHAALYPTAIPVFCGGTASAGRSAGNACHAALYPAAIPVFCGVAAIAGCGAGSARHAALHIASPPPDNQMELTFSQKITS
jgi:hypothetical protein